MKSQGPMELTSAMGDQELRRANRAGKDPGASLTYFQYSGMLKFIGICWKAEVVATENVRCSIQPKLFYNTVALS